MSKASELLKAKATQSLNRENLGTLQSPPPETPSAPTPTKRLGKQVVVELPLSTANMLRKRVFELDTSQALVIQALVEAWLHDEIKVDLSRPTRPVRTRHGQQSI